jgi:polar amino acid transport system ATP-binding protein
VNLLEPIDEGQIVVERREVTAPGVDANEVRRGIGIVFQAFNLFPHMTVLRNVTLAPQEVLGRPPAEAEADAVELLRRFGLADKRDDYPDRLSGGQQQRVAAGAMTMLIATHEIGFAREIADQVCFLDEGVILEHGPPEQIFSAPKKPRSRQFLQRIVEAGRL